MGMKGSLHSAVLNYTHTCFTGTCSLHHTHTHTHTHTLSHNAQAYNTMSLTDVGVTLIELQKLPLGS